MSIKCAILIFFTQAKGVQMNNTERENRITELVEARGFMSVNELSALLYTSPSSIRRDLARLEGKRLIKRTHGGAAPAKDTKNLSPFHMRKSMNKEKKKLAAAKAAFLIKDSMSVMIDGSSTALEILPYLKERKDIKLFTNSLYAYSRAAELGIEVYCLGGGGSLDTEILAGSITEQTVSRLYTDILFFSSKCVSDDGEITDPIDCENRLRRVMLEHAKIKVFLYDSTKSGTSALFKLCNTADIDYCFSDSEA